MKPYYGVIKAVKSVSIILIMSTQKMETLNMIP